MMSNFRAVVMARTLCFGALYQLRLCRHDAALMAELFRFGPVCFRNSPAGSQTIRTSV
ncbi:hypothetical protein MES5069_360070 [Mesorhizobium escarrei]|uniref:Uncharacterized protein n=1 Tax=Mesorhizobium escarrei TaxID=666018 RepID=A0ABN8K0B9_9HYPH|nr:hypothetical protein MES5069_360070 [Mesorhizobium escarrei]